MIETPPEIYHDQDTCDRGNHVTVEGVIGGIMITFWQNLIKRGRGQTTGDILSLENLYRRIKMYVIDELRESGEMPLVDEWRLAYLTNFPKFVAQFVYPKELKRLTMRGLVTGFENIGDDKLKIINELFNNEEYECCVRMWLLFGIEGLDRHSSYYRNTINALCQLSIDYELPEK